MIKAASDAKDEEPMEEENVDERVSQMEALTPIACSHLTFSAPRLGVMQRRRK